MMIRQGDIIGYDDVDVETEDMEEDKIAITITIPKELYGLILQGCKLSSQSELILCNAIYDGTVLTDDSSENEEK